MEHSLYRLEKTKIAFEYYRLIDSKPCPPSFNYPKFYAVIYFAQCIWGYGNAINYNTVHSKVAYKYLFKAIYNRTNKKEYVVQIWQHNLRHMKVIIIKDDYIKKSSKKGRIVGSEKCGQNCAGGKWENIESNGSW